MEDYEPNPIKHTVIRFQDNDFRLTTEWLRKQVDAGTLKKGGWGEAPLKFVSFREGRLLLLNTCDDVSVKLILVVQDSRLLVTCSCDHAGPGICIHPLTGLRNIIWHLGDHYFAKLQPGGAMPLAFAHRKYFDRKESPSGLDVSPRPELKSIYKIAPKVEKIDLAAIMKLPATPAKKDRPPPVAGAKVAPHPVAPAKKAAVHPGQALAYIILIPMRYRRLPAVIPCMGKTTKSGTEIKTFGKFLDGIQKEYSHLLTESQKETNTACLQLWKMVEKLPGGLIDGQPVKKSEEKLPAVWGAWQKLIPLLHKQFFTYSHPFYGGGLKGRPMKKHLRPLNICNDQPELRFLLSEDDAFYRLEMQVWVNNKMLGRYDAGITFFIHYNDSLFMLGSLRDATVAEWMSRSEGRVTVFKEHFQQFEKDLLNPLRANYSVETVAAKKTTKESL